MDSLKKYLSLAYCSTPLIDGYENNKVIIVTPSGVITGSPVSKDESNDFVKHFTSLTEEYAKQYREDHSLTPDQLLDGNDGCVVLKDVTLKSGNNIFNFSILNIFLDQIVAITIGNLE